MQRIRRHPLITTFAAAVLVFAIAVVGFGVYLAGEAGELPWQTPPTRIAITPFAGIPGFDPAAAAAAPAGTPAP